MPVNVLMVASECYPLIKTGGLADVVGALPAALAGTGCRTRVMLPAYPAAKERATGAKAVAAFDDLFGGPASILAARAQPGLDLLLVDAPHLYDRPGNPYLGADGRDWPDNSRRFAGMCFAAAHFARQAPDGWKTDIVHGHDWQAGLVPAYLRSAPERPDRKSVV